MRARPAPGVSATALLPPLALLLLVTGLARPSAAQDERPREGAAAARTVLGAASSPVADRLPRHTLSPGERVLAAPRWDAETVLVVPDEARGPLDAVVVDERDHGSVRWLRIRWAGRLGWVRAGASVGVVTGSLSPRRRERRNELLEVAVAAVGAPTPRTWRLEEEAPVASVRVWSDWDERRLGRIRLVARCLPSLYRERFGMGARVPVEVRSAAQSRDRVPVDVVVFAEPGAYRRFVTSQLAVPPSETGGLEVDGLVLVDATRRLEVDLLGTVAHELVHALNRSAFPPGTELSPWIEEGMAEDLAHAVEAAHVTGRPLCSLPGGWSRSERTETTEIVDEEAKIRIDVVRSDRARQVICYEGPDPDSPDPRDLRVGELAAAPERPRLYLESLLLLRSLLAVADDPAEALLDPPVLDRSDAIAGVLGPLAWRWEERELLACGGGFEEDR